jgi:hypothetical protein
VSTLVLPLKGIYFDQIKSGVKRWEYRFWNPYWRKRLEGRTYDTVTLTKGYPARDDAERRMVLPWRGFRVQIIEHEHFGPDPVLVFAIRVAPTRPKDTPNV